MSFEIQDHEYLFSILNDNADKYIDLYNRYLFLVKMFIWECRGTCKPTSLNDFIKFLIKEINFEYQRLKMRGNIAQQICVNNVQIIKNL